MAKKHPDLEYKGHAPVYGPKKSGSVMETLGWVVIIFFALVLLGQCAG